MLNLEYMKLHPNAKAPTKSYDAAAGWDIYVVGDEGFFGSIAPLPHGEPRHKVYKLQPGETRVFHTGLAMKMPDVVVRLDPQRLPISGYSRNSIEHMYHGFIWDRSGIACKNSIHRFAGVIDNDFRGEWMVCLHNAGHDPFPIRPGDKIAQVVVQLVPILGTEEVTSLDDTTRGKKGFGSSG